MGVVSQLRAPQYPLPTPRSRVYTEKVNRLLPIAYWPLADGGSVVTDESGNGRHGTYSNATLNTQSITVPSHVGERIVPLTDGRSAASFNGSTSYANIYSVSLANAFNSQTGTLLAWINLSGAALAETAFKRAVGFRVDANNDVYIQKTSTANQMQAGYVAGGTGKSINITVTQGWHVIALTWDKPNDEVKAYYDGVQQGVTQTGLGTWAGSLSSTAVIIGARLTTPDQLFNGLIAHVAVFSSVLTPAQVLNLSSLTLPYDNTYLLRDTFSIPNNKAAPLIVRQCEPGPGTLVISDVAQVLSITNGEVKAASSIATAAALASQQSFSRSAGLALIGTRIIANVGATEQGAWGLHSNQNSGTRLNQGWHQATSNLFVNYTTNLGTDSVAVVSGLSVGNVYELAVVVRGTGAFYFYRLQGSANWTLGWVSVHQTATPLYGNWGFSTSAALSRLDDARIVSLPSPFTTDTGFATDRKATNLANDTITHLADCVVEQTIVWSAGTKHIHVRRTDASNHWDFEIDGSNIYLNEVNAGVLTTRHVVANILTNGTSYRFVIVCEGTTIKSYVNNVAKNTYSSATFNQTATTAFAGAAGSEFVSWPRTYDLSTDIAGGETLLLDQFNDVQEAGFGMFRYGEVGRLQVIDTNGIMSLASDRLNINGTSAANDRIFSAAAYARKIGRAFLLSIPERTTVGNNDRIGFDSSNGASATIDIGFDYNNTSAVRMKSGTVLITTHTIGSGQHDCAFVMRNSGGYLLLRNGTSGVYKLAWVYATGTATQYAKVFLNSAVARNFQVSNWRVVDFTDAAWTTDYGIATQRVASPADGETFTGTADGIFEITFTFVTGSQPKLLIRRTDDSNAWYIQSNVAGTALEIVEINGGVSTVRATASITFVNGTSYRIVAIAEETTITGFAGVATAEPTTAIPSYTSATFNQSATGVKWMAGLSTPYSNLVAWPRTITLPSV